MVFHSAHASTYWHSTHAKVFNKMKINNIDFLLKIRLAHIGLITIICAIIEPLKTKILGSHFDLIIITALSFLFPAASLLSFLTKNINIELQYNISLFGGLMCFVTTLLFYLNILNGVEYILLILFFEFLIIIFGTNVRIELNTAVSQTYTRSIFKKYQHYSNIISNILFCCAAGVLIILQYISDSLSYTLIFLMSIELAIFVFDLIFKNKILSICR